MLLKLTTIVNLQSQNVIRENLRKAELLYKKVEYKMMVKLTTEI